MRKQKIPIISFGLVVILLLSSFAIAADTCILKFKEGSAPGNLSPNDVTFNCSDAGKWHFGKVAAKNLTKTDEKKQEAEAPKNISGNTTQSKSNGTVADLAKERSKKNLTPYFAVLAVLLALSAAYVILKRKKRGAYDRSFKKIVGEEVMYQKIFSITAHIESLERRIIVALYIMSLGFLIFFKATNDNIMILTAMLSFGFATSLLFRRNLDIRFGGMSTFALLLYYSVGNLWIFAHFLFVALVCMPVGIFFMRRGYLGQILFYVLSLVVFPVTVISYYLLIHAIPPYSLLPYNVIYHAGDIIYIVLPQIYLYTILQLEKKKIMADILYLAVLLAVSVAFWVGVIYLIV